MPLSTNSENVLEFGLLSVILPDVFWRHVVWLNMWLLTPSLVAEVMAVLETFTFCKEGGFFDVIFEGDALLVVKAIADTSSYNFSRIGHFVDSIRMKMRFLRCASVVHACFSAV
jgi:hypothetical protein